MSSDPKLDDLFIIYSLRNIWALLKIQSSKQNEAREKNGYAAYA